MSRAQKNSSEYTKADKAFSNELIAMNLLLCKNLLQTVTLTGKTYYVAASSSTNDLVAVSNIFIKNSCSSDPRSNGSNPILDFLAILLKNLFIRPRTLSNCPVLRCYVLICYFFYIWRESHNFDFF